MEFSFGVIFHKKRIKISTDIWTDVYKVIGYGNCCKAEDVPNSFYFYEGAFKGKFITDLFKTTGADEICATENWPMNIDVPKTLDSLINDSNTYLKITSDNSNKININILEDKSLIAKCKIAFNYNIVGLDKKDEATSIKNNNPNIILADLNSQSINSKNTFLTYNVEEKYKILKEHVFGQDDQLKQILSCVIKNLNLIDLDLHSDIVAKLKSNILLLGKTGVGKTLIIKEMAKLLNIPYVIEDATRYTGTGWAGEDIEDMIRNLYVASNNDLTKAQNGILVVDEFDKLCKRTESSEHATITVQQSLLKLIEGTKINISRTNHTNIGGFEFDTSKLTIIFAGAFDGMDKIIDKRTNERKPGFNTTQVEEKDKNTQIEDLIEFGMIRELSGRISNIIALNNPNKEDLKNAFLYSKSSALNLLKTYLNANGVKVESDEAFSDAIVDKALSLNIGYRGLNQALNSVVEPELFDIITGKNKVLSLTSEKVK